MRLALISGAFPPQFDGIGDHTWWLAQALTKQGHEITVFTSFGPDRPQPPNFKLVTCFDASKPQTVGQAIHEIGQTGQFDWLVIQYNPFSYGRRGFAPWLVSSVRSCRIPVAFIFHETYAVPFWPWQHILMRFWQYPQFVALARLGRCHFVSTERWLAQVRRWAKAPSFLFPVGSNLPLCPLTKAEARERLGISPKALVLGVFGFAHMSRRTDWITGAARLIRERFPQTVVLAIGEIGAQLENACGDVPVYDHGFLPGPEVSLRLLAMDLFLAPFTDGISGRRGSVIAAFQHGLPICSTVRDHSDSFLKELSSPAYSITPGDDEQLFKDAALAMAEKVFAHPDLGHDLVEFHDRHFAWPVLAAKLSAGLSTAQPAAPQARLHSSQP